MAAERISLRARTIAIVGAGPSGVIAAKYLRAEKAFDKIVLFEQRSTPGGIWNYTGDQKTENLFSIPQTNPHPGPQKPEWVSSSNASNSEPGTPGAHKTPSFLSPMYEKLETNIPRGLMGFQDLDWPQESQLFPTHSTVLKYITNYSKDVQDLVQYETQVTKLTPTSASSPSSPWAVTVQNLRTSQTTTSTFDAVIVANGHFIVPYIPSIPGIEAWHAAHPTRITHAKYYRRPETYAGQRVVVVGNSASGADISNQIAAYCAHPLLWSTRSESVFSASHGDKDAQVRRDVGQIAAFLPATRGVQFADGTVAHDIDAVVFATGYLYSLPFLEGVEPALITDGTHVENTYKHLFYAHRPSLSFLALNQRVIPFPLAEAQAAVLARVYAGRLGLPVYEEMRAWEEDWEKEIREANPAADGRAFHLLPFPKDGHYINEMSNWVLSAEKRDGLENEGQGKIPPVWGDWEFWCREKFPAIRQAFGKLGSRRFEVRSIEEVGFDYEADTRAKKQKEGREGVEGEEII